MLSTYSSLPKTMNGAVSAKALTVVARAASVPAVEMRMLGVGGCVFEVQP